MMLRFVNVVLERGVRVKALRVALICSGSPGFLRSLGSLMAGQCRLMECYSLPEASQMIQLHEPDLAVFDVRSASPQQLARTFAAISNVRPMDCVLVTVTGQLTEDHIPEEVLRRVRIAELSNHDENYHELTEAILSPVLALPVASEAAHSHATSVGPNITSTNSSKSTESHSAADEPKPAPRFTIPDKADPTNAAASDAGVMSEKFRTRTPELRAMLRRLEVAARHNVTILLIGETGAGKTHLASLIHESSPRASEPFLHVACGALPGELIESVLW